MKKTTIEEQNIYTCEDFYTPRKQDLDNHLWKLGVLFLTVLLGITLLYLIG